MRKAAVIFIIALLAVSAQAKPALEIGQAPASFTLSDTRGKTVSLKDYLGKKTIILSFFASWSESCQEEVLFLRELYDKYKTKGLKIMGISFDRKTEKLKSFINENSIEFDILHDKKLKTLRDFRILIIPTLLVIDQKGNLKSIYVDFDKNVKTAVTKEIKKLLK